MMARAVPKQSWFALGLIARPTAFNLQQSAAVLVETVGYAFADAMLRIVREPPSVIGAADHADPLERGAALFRQAGGDAFVCSAFDLDACGPAIQVRALEVLPNVVRITEHRTDRVVDVPTRDVRLLVRGRVRDRTGPGTLGPTGSSTLGFLAATRVRHHSSGLAGVGPNPLVPEETNEAESETNLIEFLDIHVAGGGGPMLFRLDGRRFGYAALGSMRQYTDRINMDLMMELLSHLSPDEIVDTYFDLWKPPVDSERFRYREMPSSRSIRAFDFYSRWMACMYRYLAS